METILWTEVGLETVLVWCLNLRNFEIVFAASSTIYDICMELVCFSGTLTIETFLCHCLLLEEVFLQFLHREAIV